MADRQEDMFVFGTSAPPFDTSDDEQDWNELHYVLHLDCPRFYGRVAETDERGDAVPADRPADVLPGVLLNLADTLGVCEMTWIDPPDEDASRPRMEDLVQAYIRWL